MNDFKLFIDFAFTLLNKLWNLITSNWILTMFFLISIFGVIIGLVIQTTPKE